MGETATAVFTASDWQALYFGDDLAYQNHRVELRNVVDAIDDYNGAVSDTDTLHIDTNELGIGHLPSSLTELQEMRTFRDDVVDDIEAWEDRMRETILGFEEPPTNSQLQEQFDCEQHEFRVLKALLMRRGIRTTKTPLDREAVLAHVDNATTDDTRFTLASSENARI